MGQTFQFPISPRLQITPTEELRQGPRWEVHRAGQKPRPTAHPTPSKPGLSGNFYSSFKAFFRKDSLNHPPCPPPSHPLPQPRAQQASCNSAPHPSLGRAFRMGSGCRQERGGWGEGRAGPPGGSPGPRPRLRAVVARSVGVSGVFGPLQLHLESLHADLKAVHGLDGRLCAGRVVKAHEACGDRGGAAMVGNAGVLCSLRRCCSPGLRAREILGAGRVGPGRWDRCRRTRSNPGLVLTPAGGWAAHPSPALSLRIGVEGRWGLWGSRSPSLPPWVPGSFQALNRGLASSAAPVHLHPGSCLCVCVCPYLSVPPSLPSHRSLCLSPPLCQSVSLWPVPSPGPRTASPQSSRRPNSLAGHLKARKPTPASCLSPLGLEGWWGHRVCLL